MLTTGLSCRCPQPPCLASPKLFLLALPKSSPHLGVADLAAGVLVAALLLLLQAVRLHLQTGSTGQKCQQPVQR